MNNTIFTDQLQIDVWKLAHLISTHCPFEEVQMGFEHYFNISEVEKLKWATDNNKTMLLLELCKHYIIKYCSHIEEVVALYNKMMRTPYGKKEKKQPIKNKYDVYINDTYIYSIRLTTSEYNNITDKLNKSNQTNMRFVRK